LSDLKQKSIDAIIWNLVEKYGIQMVGLVIGIVLARLLTPSDYGLIGMITVFFAFASVFVNSGFGAAYIQKKDANEVDASTIFYFNLVVSIFFYVIFWFSAPLIAKFYEQEQLIDLFRVASIVLIINSFSMMQTTILTKEVKFKKKSLISLVSSLFSGVIGIAAALFNYGVWSLVIQQISKAIINALGLWFFYTWRPQLIFSVASLKSLFSYSSWILFANIIAVIFNNIYILTIGKFFPVAQLGFYTKAKGYQILVSQQPAAAVRVVSFPVFSKLQHDKIALKNSMKKFMQHTLFFIAPIVATLIVIANPLILVVLTQKWMPMVPYFQWLLIVGFLYPISLMNVQLLLAQGKTKLNFRISIIKNTLRILNIIVMYRFGVIYIIYGEVIVSFISILINAFYTKKLISYSFLQQLKDLSKTFLISGIIILMGFFILKIEINDYLKIAIGSLITAGGYILLQYIFNKDFFISNLEMIKSKF
jgi:O-antigen/teichoic acid export membrane protein